MRFLKMHGLGNDFVIFDARNENIFLSEEDIHQIADRRRGVGCDLITVLEQSEIADIRAQFINADGSESGACGNATRCVADIVMSEKDADECLIEVCGQLLRCRRRGELLIEVDMGQPRLAWDQIPLARDTDTLRLPLEMEGISEPVAVNMGNPHCVFFVERYEDLHLEELGNYFGHHEMFPERTNVEFVKVIDRTHLRQKTWERGVGMTEACGSGACAVAVAAVRRGLCDRKVDIELDGGILHLHWCEDDDHVLMTGPVAYVFDGEL